ncbi:MAG TPA: sulfatase [Candidatus Polarisedimenticolia bacterium]
MRVRSLFALTAIVLTFSACGAPQPPAPSTTRLIDLYGTAQVAGRADGASPLPARTEWRFDGAASSAAMIGPAATRGWQAGAGVTGLAVRDGRLIGMSADDFPLLHVERDKGLEGRDLVHAVEIRMRASAGSNLAVSFEGDEKIDFARVVEDGRAFPWLASSPIVAGEQIRTYTLRPRRAVTAPRTRHLLLRPTDVAGATFEIESVRLILRREHLASIPSGVGWQGLSEVYRETLVSRSPETILMKVALPSHPWLDLGIGTVEDEPVTFSVAVRREGQDAVADEKVLLKRTVTTPHRWESTPVDLSGFAGTTVTLAFSLGAERTGSLGFWGAPVVRDHETRAVAAASGATERPRGVIVIWADTLRRDHLDIYGYSRPTSPVLGRMAAQGVLFADCVSQATWTKVSTPSLFTSLYPSSHTVKEFADRLPSSAVTLPEVYRDAGYATLTLSSILFTGAFTNMHQGVEELHEDGSLSDQESSKTSREYVDRLLPWLELHRDVPFFVFLHVSDPHDPYKPNPPYDTMWADAGKTQEHERQAKEVRKFISDPLMKRFGMPTRDEMARAGFDPESYVSHDRDWYDGSIRGMDVEVGRLLERLESMGIDRRTLIVFIGDHGEEFLEHGRTFHGQTVYGELTNVPLIFWGPGVLPPGTVVNETVRTIDVMPTLLELSGLPAPAGIQGRSLAALLRAGRPGAPGALSAAEDSGTRGLPAVSEKAETDPVSGGAPPPHGTESYALVVEGWKLIHNTKRQAGGPEFELYDARADPLNRHDVAADHQDVVARLAGQLSAWRSLVEAGRLMPDSEATQAMSAEELERLRSLGYIQ